MKFKDFVDAYKDSSREELFELLIEQIDNYGADCVNIGYDLAMHNRDDCCYFYRETESIMRQTLWIIDKLKEENANAKQDTSGSL